MREVRRVPNGWVVMQDGRPLQVFADERFTADGTPTTESFGKAMSFVMGLQVGSGLIDGDVFTLQVHQNAYAKKTKSSE